MNDETRHLDRAEEGTLRDEISDEALETPVTRAPGGPAFHFPAATARQFPPVSRAENRRGRRRPQSSRARRQCAPLVLAAKIGCP
jgi:hypothetical protein